MVLRLSYCGPFAAENESHSTLALALLMIYSQSDATKLCRVRGKRVVQVSSDVAENRREAGVVSGCIIFNGREYNYFKKGIQRLNYLGIVRQTRTTLKVTIHFRCNAKYGHQYGRRWAICGRERLSQ